MTVRAFVAEILCMTNPVQGFLLVAVVIISWKTVRLHHLKKHPAWTCEVELMKHRAELSAEPNSPEPCRSEWGFQVFKVQKPPAGQPGCAGEGALPDETSALRATKFQLKEGASGYLWE